MTAFDPKKDEKTRAAMSEKFPLGTEVDVDGKKGKVIGHGLHSRMLIVEVAGERRKVPMPKKK